MVKPNPTFIINDLGFTSISDYVTSIIGFKGNILTPISFIFAGGLSMFIEKHMWSNPTEVYFLAILIGIDLFTGVWKSIKFRNDPDKKFRSRRISRTVGKIITYSIILYLAFNLDQNMHSIFFWMPYSCLAVFYVTETWSIIENLSEIGYLDINIVKFLKKKLNIYDIFNNQEEDNKKKENKEDDEYNKN
jgi:toxin secretion/phage lysis holin